MTEHEKEINALFSGAIQKAKLAEKLFDDAYKLGSKATHKDKQQAAARLHEAKDRLYEIVMTYGTEMTYKVSLRDLTGWT